MSNPPREIADLSAALGDRYTIERELGRGGMGAVFLARDLQLDRQVAIKVLPRELTADVMLRERFLRETRTAASFSHPNIVPVHAIEERAELLAFVMGYVEGESVSQRVARTGPLEAREILRLLLDIGYALAYAHGRGVVHRDVKPDNVMLERATGRALLMDFGISRSVASDRALPGVTRVGEVVGTPEYMSPEQSVGDVLDGRSDLYSLALTAYFAATARIVFGGETTQKILMRQLSEAPPPLATYRPDLPKVITDAVDRCLAKDPNDRFADAAALVSALEAAQSFAPEIPMPVRLFSQAVATLGIVITFVGIVIWVLLLVLKTGEGSDDLFIPAVLLISIALGRIAQAMGDARRLMRHGFTREEILRGMRGVLDEHEVRRVQLRNDAPTRAARRKTVTIALIMLVTAALLIRKTFVTYRHQIGPHSYHVDLPGSIMMLSALMEIGIAVALLGRSPLRMPISERAYRLVWLGLPGRAFFRLAGLRLKSGNNPATSPRIAVVTRPQPAAAPVVSVSRVTGANSHESRITSLEERVARIEGRS